MVYFTIANVGPKPRFTTNDDIRLGSVNEAPKFFFLSSDVGRGVLHGDSSLLVMVMSESSITESNKVAEKFGKPQLGYSQGHEDLSNTERRFE